MQRKYYHYDGSPFTPSAGVPMHAQNIPSAKAALEGQVITPTPLQKQTEHAQKDGSPKKIGDILFDGGKLLGRYETDDIIILCLIFLAFQSGDEIDWPLLLALGYIFLSDKETGLF